MRAEYAEYDVVPGHASDVAQRLEAELARLRSADPFRALGLTPSADTAEVRRAYLALVKTWHPNRYAREEQDVRDLVNEIFLHVRRAYEQLADEDKRRTWRERVRPAAPARTGTTTGTAPAIAPPPPAGTAPAAAAPARTGATPGSAPAMATPPRSPTAPAPPPAASPAKVNVRPPTTPGTGRSPEEVQALLEAARTRQTRFEDAVRLMAKGRYREAREALFHIAAEDPQKKRYRAQLHLAWGLEHLADGKPEEAQRELERALGLEPDNAEIREAMRKAQGEKKSGIFGKLFGR